MTVETGMGGGTDRPGGPTVKPSVPAARGRASWTSALSLDRPQSCHDGQDIYLSPALGPAVRWPALILAGRIVDDRCQEQGMLLRPPPLRVTLPADHCGGQFGGCSPREPCGRFSERKTSGGDDTAYLRINGVDARWGIGPRPFPVDDHGGPGRPIKEDISGPKITMTPCRSHSFGLDWRQGDQNLLNEGWRDGFQASHPATGPAIARITSRSPLGKFGGDRLQNGPALARRPPRTAGSHR